MCLKYSITFRHLCTLHRYLVHRYFIYSFIIFIVIDMPYRRRYRPFVAAAGYAAARALGSSAARSTMRFGRKVIGRVLSKIRSPRGRRSALAGRRSVRVRGQFLKSVGMRNTVYCTHVARGSRHVHGSNTNTLHETCSWYLNDPKDVTDPAGTLMGNTGAATGWSHMAAMYRHCFTMGARAYITIRPHEVNSIDTGDADVTSLIPPIKVGLYANEGNTLAVDGFDKWTDCAMLRNPMKTYIPKFNSAATPVRLTYKWSLKRWTATHGAAEAFTSYACNGSAAPSTKVLLILWDQVADQVNAAPATNASWDVDWTIKYFCKWTEPTSIEDDMKQAEPT